MVEETLSSIVPGVDVHPAPKEKTQTPADTQIAAKKSASSRAAGKPVSRQQKLILHLFIGLLMSILVIAGYSFLGPDASANAAEMADYPMVDVTTYAPAAVIDPQTPLTPAMDSNNASSDLAALQAEMAELTRQMNALKAQGIPGAPSTGAANSVSGMAGQGQGVMSPMQSRLNGMMSMAHGMMNTMNGVNGQAGGTSRQSGAAGHTGHH